MSIDEQISLIDGYVPGLGVAPLQITVSQMEDRTLIVVAGELDSLTVPFMRQKLVDVVEAGAGDVVLDIGLLKFIDSTGLALFLTFHKKLDVDGHKLVIAAGAATRRAFVIPPIHLPPHHTLALGHGSFSPTWAFPMSQAARYNFERRDDAPPMASQTQ
jgi:anti-anti-sigma factor